MLELTIEESVHVQSVNADQLLEWDVDKTMAMVFGKTDTTTTQFYGDHYDVKNEYNLTRTIFLFFQSKVHLEMFILLSHLHIIIIVILLDK